MSDTTTAARRLLQELHLEQLGWLFDGVNDLRQTALDDDQLETLLIQKLPAIDVDEIAPFDPDPLFIHPYPLADDDRDFPTVVAQALEDGQPRWKSLCDQDNCNSDVCASRRSNWFVDSFGTCGEGIRENTIWDRPTSQLCDPYIDDCRRDQAIGNWGHPNEFFSKSVFRVRGGNKPHTAMMVRDSASGESGILASEIMTAISVLRYRLRHGEFVDHHTIPALVYSFHHDQFARITQAHWDGAKLVIRQSRLLDLRGAEPTEDAYLLLRWMASKPVGETEYQKIQGNSPASGSDQPRLAAEVIAVQA